MLAKRIDALAQSLDGDLVRARRRHGIVGAGPLPYDADVVANVADVLFHVRSQRAEQLPLLHATEAVEKFEVRREERVLASLDVLEHSPRALGVPLAQRQGIEPQHWLDQVLHVAHVGVAVPQGAATKAALEDLEVQSVQPGLRHGLERRLGLRGDVHLRQARAANLREHLRAAPAAGVIGVDAARQTRIYVLRRRRNDDEHVGD
mmetsp:Transcript_67699/g.207436  ORF Transcript_67699/g.207436 Transcript_67699/m.207436 type:complete len:205 (-) Transcript_67699:2372-2986(-)